MFLSLTRRRLLSVLSLWILSLSLALSLAAPGWGQLDQLPEAVRNLRWQLDYQDSGRIGNLEYKAVRLDGAPLFMVAVPISAEDEKDQGQGVQTRVTRVENKIKEIIRRGFDPKTLTVTSAVLNGQNVLQVSDGQSLRPTVVGTITSADAEFYALSVEELSQEGINILRAALLKAHQERQPAVLRKRVWAALQVLALVAALSWAVLFLYRWLIHRVTLFKTFLGQLAQEKTAPNDAKVNAPGSMKTVDKILIKTFLFFYQLKKWVFREKNSSSEPASIHSPFLNSDYLFGEFLRVTGREECRRILINRIRTLIFIRRLLLISLILIWNRALAIILTFFPYTRALGIQLAGAPFFLILIWLGVLLAIKAIEWGIDLLLKAWSEDYRLLHQDDLSRQVVRIPTLGSALKGVNLVFCCFLGLLLSLVVFRVPVASILAGAGILGFAISFGSQNVIKDLIAGLTTLINDSYAVGDFVILGAFSGTVEKMNLFVTRLRNASGDLITIPNGSIITVCNQTKEWSRVDYSVIVAADTDISKAMALMREVARDLCHDPQWRDSVLDEPDLKGIEDVTHQGVTLRIWIKTKPGEQWDVGRTLRLRLILAFEKAGIAIGVPKQTFIMENPGVPSGSDPNTLEI
ncbi:MAG: mechanosensitive ion channel [Cyanobacteria bacterium RI_101]|nr:mechanosensitive ion channel [Cyanobacteria bacterium RI_101]